MQSLTPAARRRLLWTLTLVAPLAAVQAVRLLEGGGPAAAPAATVESTGVGSDPAANPALAALPPAAPLTPAQRQALEFLQVYKLPERLRSPMDSPKPAPPATVAPEVHVPLPSTGPDPSRLVVTAIVGIDGGAVAVIGNKPVRVGDEVLPGWRLRSIDARGRTVLLGNDEGETVMLAPPGPSR